MPIYEYLCTICGHQFDVLQKMTDPQISHCEQCGKPVRRVISASGIVFKGSGWYVTDYGTRKKDDRKDDRKNDGPAKTDKKKEQPAAASEGSDKKAVPATTGDTAPKTDPSKADTSKTDSAKDTPPAS